MTNTPATDVVSGETTTVSTHTNTSYIVMPTGTLDVARGGTVTGALASGPGSVIVIDSGGKSINSTIAGGAEYDYGKTTGTIVKVGGSQHVYLGGVAIGSIIEAGGYQEVRNGKVIDTLLAGSQQVLSNGIAIGTIIQGGEQYVGTGGLTRGTIIEANGRQYVDVGATAKGTDIQDGGFQYVAGIANNTTVDNGGTQSVAGTAYGTTVADGGVQHVLNDGIVINTTVEAGGFQEIVDAVAKRTYLSGGQQVLAGGVSTNTEIAAGGDEYIGAGGTSIGSIVNNDALQYVDAGGLAINTTIAGGLDFVAAGGMAINTKVEDGELLVKGVAEGSRLSGGSEYVYAGGIQNNVNFEGSSATLFLEDPSGLSGKVSNFEVGDTIDFLGTSFTSVNFDGSTLTLATATANYTYQFKGIEDNAALIVTRDNHGGTSVSLALLSELSASLVPESGIDGSVSPQDMASTNPTLVNAQT